MRRLIFAAFLFAVLTRPSGAQSADEQNVLAVVSRLFDGMRTGDSSVVRSTFHANIRLISASSRNGKVTINIEANADGFAKLVGTPHSVTYNERISNPRVHIDGPLASVWADYTFHAGDTFSHCGVDHFLLVKDDTGAWKILELSDTRRTDGCS